jgi:pyruvate dehydrogenase E1 component
VPYLTQQLKGHQGPVVLATDYLKALGEQLRGFVPGDYQVLGTDGFGRSDTRERLRDFFEVNRNHIALAALHGLQRSGAIEASVVSAAMAKLGIAPDKADPLTV